MALDREKTFLNAERLLKQGKVAQALDECRRLAEEAPKDLLMLNRLGDVLAKNNRGGEAIVYYERIVADFTASGFYPKAIAILKKIVKVDPNQLSAAVRLGELNVKQKLPGEARTWFAQAAEAYLRAGEFGKARDVYERLLATDPDNSTYVARLAEAAAAAGDADRAGQEFVTLGERMLASGKHEEAEKAFARAAEASPGRAAPVVGLARCRAAAGRREEALGLAEKAWSTGTGADALAGEIFRLFEQSGDVKRSAAFLSDPRSDAVSEEALEQAFRSALVAGEVDAMWTRIQPLLDRWKREHHYDRLTRLLDRIARTEDGGHLRALEQLVEMRKAEGNLSAAARVVERLVRAYQANGETAKANAQLQSLKQLDASSPVLFVGRPSAGAPAEGEAKPAPQEDALPAPGFEAPAVPIAPADHEFVSGNLTEAEVFEKYGLNREAFQQLRQVTDRFPGHVGAQEKLVGFLRTQSDRRALRDGLVALAVAKRASGDSEGARRAAGEAAAIGGIEPSARAFLERFGLVARDERPEAKEAVPPPPAPPAPVAVPAEPPAQAAPITRAEEEELEILFEDVDEAAPEAASGGNDALEEIAFYLEQGMNQDALSRIADARKTGQASAELDALEARAREAVASAEAVAEVVEDEPAPGEGRLDEEDLASITAALEAEYGDDRPEGGGEPAPEPESEQSVDQVFDTFKEHVRASVEAGDFRTHYDLGIAYKEMGLIDDALAEFRIASGAPELYREACSMLGLCLWERGESEEAIRWYRAAIDAPGGDEVPLAGLRYDLATMLEASGDARGAYDLLSQVVAEEPGFRDADSRMATLRGRLGL